MMANLEEVSDINVFFYYGLLSDELEREHNLMAGVLQPERSFYYNRSDSVGITSYENHPNNLMLQIKLRFAIANWVNFYNSYTGDGSNGTKERRMAISQFSILFEQSSDSINLDLYYIPFSDYSQLKSVKLGIGGK